MSTQHSSKLSEAKNEHPRHSKPTIRMGSVTYEAAT
jgi:hypothetical protein